MLNRSKAIAHIKHHGILLVFPINNSKEPRSLWSVSFPKSPMRWEWDEEGDNRVVELWHLRATLSTSRKVIYSKWYQGRATFFSLPVFQALLAERIRANARQNLSREAKNILSLLEERSPLSTKQLKKASGLVGRALERDYEKALKELWQSLLIVAYGEVDEGAFPSLAIGSSKLLFEDLYNAAEAGEADQAALEKCMRSQEKLQRFYQKTYQKNLSAT